MIVTVQFVNHAKPGSKWGNLKMADGNKIMCPQDMIHHFRQGTTYDIPTKQQTWGDGPVTIVAAAPLQGGLGANPQPVGYGAPGADIYAPPANTGSQLRVVQGGRTEAPYGVPPTNQGREIFVTGIVGRAMGSGKFTASEIPVLAKAAAAAWDEVTKPPAKAELTGAHTLADDPGNNEPM